MKSIILILAIIAIFNIVEIQATTKSHHSHSQTSLSSTSSSSTTSSIHTHSAHLHRQHRSKVGRSLSPKKGNKSTINNYLNLLKSIEENENNIKQSNVQNYDTPSQIRLAFVPDGMTVSWATVSSYSSSPFVVYGTDPNHLFEISTGSSHTYGTRYFHDVVLTDLKSSTKYYYLPMNETSIQNTPFSFTTAIQPGDSTPFNLLVVGDMGLDNSENTISSLKKEVDTTNFIYHIGDLSYADDFFLRYNNTYEGSWNVWQTIMQPITSSVAYMSLPGNHESTCDEVTPFLCPAVQRNFTAYRHRFRMPSFESGGVENMWYSYDYGLVHFISLSTETDFPNAPDGPDKYMKSGPFGDQMQWLVDDLEKATANRQHVPWIVVAGHRPWYSSAKSGHCPACGDAFEVLFNKYNIDIYFTGHVHWYERLYPTAPNGNITQTNYVNPTAPVYIVNGAGGNVEGHEGLGTLQPYTAFYDNTHFGYGRLSVQNSTTVQWTYYAADDGHVVDTVTIQKEH